MTSPEAASIPPSTSSPISLPSNIKLPRLPMFDGRDARQVRPWLEQVRSRLMVQGIDLDSRAAVFFTTAHFTDRARTRLMSRKHQTGDPDCAGYNTFQLLCEAMIVEFGDPNPRQTARDRLARCRQIGPVVQYAHQFRSTIVDLPNRDEEHNIDDFLK